MNFKAAYKTKIEDACSALKRGETILFPTDTIWGIGCDATNEDAVAKIYKVKQRDLSKALVILVAKLDDIAIYADKIPEVAWDLVEFAEKPLTVVYEKGKNLASNLTAADGSVAIRVVKDPFCQQLIERYGKPLVATSANLSGKENPTSYNQIDPLVIASVDHIVDHRQEEEIKNKPSQIIKLDENGSIKFIRK